MNKNEVLCPSCSRNLGLTGEALLVGVLAKKNSADKKDVIEVNICCDCGYQGYAFINLEDLVRCDPLDRDGDEL